MVDLRYSEPYRHARGDRFGSTVNRPTPHRGQDTAPGGKPAVALADGLVAGIRNVRPDGRLENGILGKIVVVQHADGKFSGYAHLASISVRVGQAVKRGQPLGVIGNTGSASAGRHLHYTLGNDKFGVEFGHVQDPIAWITAHEHVPTIRPSGRQMLRTLGRSHRDWAWWEPTGELGKRVQRALAARGRYNVEDGRARPIDGNFGFFARCGVQETLRVSKVFVGRIDGKPGRGAAFGVQDYARKFGGYRGPRDGHPRERSWAAFAVGLERP